MTTRANPRRPRGAPTKATRHAPRVAAWHLRGPARQWNEGGIYSYYFDDCSGVPRQAWKAAGLPTLRPDRHRNRDLHVCATVARRPFKGSQRWHRCPSVDCWHGPTGSGLGACPAGLVQWLGSWPAELPPVVWVRFHLETAKRS